MKEKISCKMHLGVAFLWTARKGGAKLPRAVLTNTRRDSAEVTGKEQLVSYIFYFRLSRKGRGRSPHQCYDLLRFCNFFTALRMMSACRGLRGNRNLRPAYFIIRRFLIIARRQGQTINHP